VGRRDKINVVAASSLEIDHGRRKFLVGAGSPVFPHANLIVLTEEAFEVAVGQENRARAPEPTRGASSP